MSVNRGTIYHARVLFPDATQLPHMVIPLRTVRGSNETEVACVVAVTDRSGLPPRPFELKFRAYGDGGCYRRFRRTTLIDARLVQGVRLFDIDPPPIDRLTAYDLYTLESALLDALQIDVDAPEPSGPSGLLTKHDFT